MPNSVTVPQIDMSQSQTISGLPELQSHLQQLQDDPSTPFNPKLFDDVELQLTEENTPPLLPLLLPPLTTILRSTTQDPSPLLSLTIKLLRPLSFLHVLTIADPPSILTALRSPLPGANLLALSILHKAASTPADAALLAATMPELAHELVHVWLASADVGVAEKAAKVLGDVFETDCPAAAAAQSGNDRPTVNGVNVNGMDVVRRHVPGYGKVWDLLFGQEEFAQLIPEHCTLPRDDNDATALRQVTLSQGRLLRLLVRLSTLSLRPLITTPFPQLFPHQSHQATDVGNGVLQWAALGMIDRSDVLMHMTWVDFFESFVSVMRVAERDREADDAVRKLLKAACALDGGELEAALRGLPDRTVEDEAEPLRRYISEMLA